MPIIDGHGVFKWQLGQTGPTNKNEQIFELFQLCKDGVITKVATVRPFFTGLDFVIRGYIIMVNYEGYNWSDSIDFDKNHKQTLKHAFSIAERYIETRNLKCLDR